MGVNSQMMSFKLHRRKFIFFTFAVGIGGSFQFGFNISAINPPSEHIKKFINETWIERYEKPLQEYSLMLLWSIIVSIYPVGGLIGAQFAAVFTLKYGRKKSLLCNDIVAIVAALIMGFSKMARSFEMIVVGRFLYGINVGIGLVAHGLYLGEIAPKNLRGAVCMTRAVFAAFGKWMGLVVGLRQILGDESTWHLLLAFSGLPALIQLIILPWLPESPRYLLMEKGNRDLCIDALQKLWGTGDFTEEVEDMMAEQAQMQGASKRNLLQLVRDKMVRCQLLTAVAVSAGMQLSGINISHLKKKNYKDGNHRNVDNSQQNVCWVALGTRMGPRAASCPPLVTLAQQVEVSPWPKSPRGETARETMQVTVQKSTHLLDAATFTHCDMANRKIKIRRINQEETWIRREMLSIREGLTSTGQHERQEWWKYPVSRKCGHTLVGWGLDADTSPPKGISFWQKGNIDWHHDNSFRRLVSDIDSGPIRSNRQNRIQPGIDLPSKIYFYASDVYHQLGISKDNIPYVGIGSSGIEMLTSVMCGFIIERTGRKALLWKGYCFMALWMLLLIITLSLKEKFSWIPYCSLVFIFAYIFTFGMGAGSVSGVLPLEIFTQPNRCIALVAANSLQWLSLFGLGLVFPFVISGLGHFSFFLFFISCSLASLFTFYILPETKGKTLLQISEDFNNLRIAWQKGMCSVICKRPIIANQTEILSTRL
ncbi:solute carrier family 2, facilitated glucose transporter member 11-like [Mustelus asterias]